MSVKSRIEKLEPKGGIVARKSIETWDDYIVLGHGYTWQLTDKQIEQLEPYRQMFEAGTLTIKNDICAIMDILY